MPMATFWSSNHDVLLSLRLRTCAVTSKIAVSFRHVHMIVMCNKSFTCCLSDNSNFALLCRWSSTEAENAEAATAYKHKWTGPSTMSHLPKSSTFTLKGTTNAQTKVSRKILLVLSTTTNSKDQEWEQHFEKCWVMIIVGKLRSLQIHSINLYGWRCTIRQVRVVERGYLYAVCASLVEYTG